jgi:hypothetical protein
LKKTKEEEQEKKDDEQKQEQPFIQVHESGNEEDPLTIRSMPKSNSKNIISINSIRTSDNSRVIINNVAVLEKDDENSEFEQQLDLLEGHINFLHDDTS